VVGGSSTEISRVPKEHETAENEGQIRGRPYAKNAEVSGDEPLCFWVDHVRCERQSDAPQSGV
jgi:hypothetical protein